MSVKYVLLATAFASGMSFVFNYSVCIYLMDINEMLFIKLEKIQTAIIKANKQLNKLVDKLHELELSGTATELSGTATELSGTATELSGTATELSGTATELSGTATEIIADSTAVTFIEYSGKKEESRKRHWIKYFFKFY